MNKNNFIPIRIITLNKVDDQTIILEEKKINIDGQNYTVEEIKKMTRHEVTVLIAQCDEMKMIFNIALAYGGDDIYQYALGIEASSNYI